MTAVWFLVGPCTTWPIITRHCTFYFIASKNCGTLPDVLDAGLGNRTSKVQMQVFDEAREARLTAIEYRASNPFSDGQRRKATEKGHGDWYSNSLLGGVPLQPTCISTQEFQVSVQSMLGVGVTCLTPITDHTIISNASTADKRVNVYGNNLKKCGGM